LLAATASGFSIDRVLCFSTELTTFPIYLFYLLAGGFDGSNQGRSQFGR